MVGITTSDYVGFVALFPDTHLVADTCDSPALETVRDLFQEWKIRGRLRTEDLDVGTIAVTGGGTLSLPKPTI